MSLRHDLHQFIRQGAKSATPTNHDFVNGWIIATFLVWLFGGLIALIVLAMVFGWAWLVLVPFWIAMAVFIGRFGRFYSDKHETRLRW